jgi:hypothetical protein
MCRDKTSAAVANWALSNKMSMALHNSSCPATDFAHEIFKISVARWLLFENFQRLIPHFSGLGFLLRCIPVATWKM